MTVFTIKLKINPNGQKIVSITNHRSRGFSIQTNQNLPLIHKMSFDLLDHAVALEEIREHIFYNGTEYQKRYVECPIQDDEDVLKLFKGLESGFHSVKEKVSRTEDCDYGPCVGINVMNGKEHVTLWLYTDTEEQAKEVEAAMSNHLNRVQVINFGMFRGS